MTSIKLTVTVELNQADLANLLVKCNIPLTEYARLLRELHATGYDLNDDDGVLLTSACAKQNYEQVSLLLSLGAQVCSDTRLFSGNNGNVYYSGRVYTPELGALLLEHTLKSKHLNTVIKTALISQGSGNRIDVFNNVVNDTARAELYTVMGKLPTARPNQEIVDLCATAGLYYPEDLRAKNTRDLQLENTDLKERLAKATGIIAKLTSIN